MHAARFFLIWAALMISSLIAQDFSQWRGEKRDGHFPEKKLLKEWPEGGLQKLWSVENLGMGYSSATVVGDMVYTTGKKESMEVLTAMDMAGKILWELPYGKAAANNGFPAARTTPTYDGGRLYLISGNGEVVCVDPARQKVLWTVDAFTRFNGQKGTWETAETPLVIDNKVIYTPAGDQTTVVALDKNSGETVWTSPTLNDVSAYVSPILVRYAGKDMIVTVTARYLLAVNAADGKLLWKFDYAAQEGLNGPADASQINCNSPVYHDGRIFVTSGYDHTGLQVKLHEDGMGVDLAWSAPVLDTHIGGVVLVDGYLYGSNWINNRKGNWVCLDWETGALQYEEPWHNKGSIVAADGMIYCYEEKRGNLALVRPNPEKFEVVSSMQIEQGEGPHWAHPVIKNGVLYIRHGEVLMAFKVKAAS